MSDPTSPSLSDLRQSLRRASTGAPLELVEREARRHRQYADRERDQLALWTMAVASLLVLAAVVLWPSSSQHQVVHASPVYRSADAQFGPETRSHGEAESASTWWGGDRRGDRPAGSHLGATLPAQPGRCTEGTDLPSVVRQTSGFKMLSFWRHKTNDDTACGAGAR